MEVFASAYATPSVISVAHRSKLATSTDNCPTCPKKNPPTGSPLSSRTSYTAHPPTRTHPLQCINAPLAAELGTGLRAGYADPQALSSLNITPRTSPPPPNRPPTAQEPTYRPHSVSASTRSNSKLRSAGSNPSGTPHMPPVSILKPLRSLPPAKLPNSILTCRCHLRYGSRRPVR